MLENRGVIMTDTSSSSLPYVDDAYNDEGAQKQVDRLIWAELQRGGNAPSQAVTDGSRAQLNLDGTSFLKGEFKRVEKGLPPQPLDQSRYQLNPPADQNLDCWIAANQNALAQLEHQQNRLLNLSLLKTYGPNAWREHNALLGKLSRSLQKSVDIMRADVEALNQSRKTTQLLCKEALNKFETARADAAAKNAAMNEACADLERHISSLQGKVGSLVDGAKLH